jgi:hypothetical protein
LIADRYETPSRDTIVEELPSPVAGSLVGRATNYSGTVQHGIRT